MKNLNRCKSPVSLNDNVLALSARRLDDEEPIHRIQPFLFDYAFGKRDQFDVLIVDDLLERIVLAARFGDARVFQIKKQIRNF